MSYKTKLNNEEIENFTSGQLVGMLTVLMYIENRGGIDDEMLQYLKKNISGKLEKLLSKPAEDILLNINGKIKDIA